MDSKCSHKDQYYGVMRLTQILFENVMLNNSLVVDEFRTV